MCESPGRRGEGGERKNRYEGTLKNTEVGFSTETDPGKIKMSVGTFSFIPERAVLSPLRKIKSCIRKTTCFSKTGKGQQENGHCHLSHRNGHIET